MVDARDLDGSDTDLLNTVMRSQLIDGKNRLTKDVVHCGIVDCFRRQTIENSPPALSYGVKQVGDSAECGPRETLHLCVGDRERRGFDMCVFTQTVYRLD